MGVDKKILRSIVNKLEYKDHVDDAEKKFFGGERLDENKGNIKKWSEKMDEPRTASTINSSNTIKISSNRPDEDQRKAA